MSEKNAETKKRQVEPTEAQKKYDELVRKYQLETDPKKKEAIKAEVVKALKDKQK